MSSFDKSQVRDTFSLLYVEDEADIRDIMLEILELFTDEVHVAGNGKEGLEAYDKFFPDIIITDIQMPMMTGLEMITEIRKRDKDIPIIVTTAFNDTNYLLDSIKQGVDHYLLKPVVVDQLQEKLDKVKKQIMQRRELDAYHLYLEDRVEEEISQREMKEALLLRQNKDVELGQMVSIIAHQWKQPLHYLHLLIEDLGFEYKEGLSQEFVDDFVNKGLGRVNFLSETMDNFLRFYKSDHRIKNFTVADVLNEVNFFLSSLFEALGIKIDINIVKDFSLKGSKNEFQQMILNLLNNAKEAFASQKKEGAKIVVTVDVPELKPRVTVRDNAGGIPDEIRDDIFGMEYTTKKDGNGIGLYLVQQIMQKGFSGSVTVKNEEGGACFTLIFD
jgi:YesN/AraC family two-component response regulator